MKSMFKDFECFGSQRDMVERVYGWRKEFRIALEEDYILNGVRVIYDKMLEHFISKNGSLIPSRNEKRKIGVSWRKTWQNLVIARGLLPSEKCFAWKMTQDMIEVGQRNHRGGKKECKNVLNNGLVCNVMESLEHRVLECEVVRDISDSVRRITCLLTEREVSWKTLLSLSFSHRRKSTRQISVWFVVKAFHMVFRSSHAKREDIFREILTEINSLIKNKLTIGSIQEMEYLKTAIENS